MVPESSMTKPPSKTWREKWSSLTINGPSVNIKIVWAGTAAALTTDVLYFKVRETASPKHA
jgi:hypothetical protein